jgi:hypothetical protein
MGPCEHPNAQKCWDRECNHDDVLFSHGVRMLPNDPSSPSRHSAAPSFLGTTARGTRPTERVDCARAAVYREFVAYH